MRMTSRLSLSVCAYERTDRRTNRNTYEADRNLCIRSAEHPVMRGPVTFKVGCPPIANGSYCYNLTEFEQCYDRSASSS